MIEDPDIYQILEIVAALIFVVGLMIIIAYVFKRMAGGDKVFSRFPKKRLRLIENLTLDSKNKMVLVQCDQKQYLMHIGQSASSLVDSSVAIPPADLQNNKRKAPTISKSKKEKKR